MCDFIYFVIFPDADYNNQHMITASDKLVYDTQTSSTEFYFKKAGLIGVVFISQDFAIAAFVFWQWIAADLLNCFPYQYFLAAIQFAEVFKGFRQVFNIPAHSNSIPSVSS